jgi:hypothetical protein
MSLDVSLTFDVDTGGVEYKCEVYSFNITHNLGKMASECKLYNPMWRPYRLYNIDDEYGASFMVEAGELYDALKFGVEELAANPEKYKKLNPDNGWGTYEGLLEVATEYMNACKDYPKAKVRVCR